VAHTHERDRAVAADHDDGGAVSDGELLERHLAGDDHAFEVLINRYRRELFSFLVRFTGNRALAEDVFQETFLQLHLSAATFDTSRRLKPWLFTIAANKGRDALRRRSRRQAAPLDAEISGSEGKATYGDLMPADVPQPDEAIMNLETRSAVKNIVDEMPENLRTVLLLNYFHGFAYKDMAEILGVPLGTVKSRLHAAVKEFAKRWKASAERNSHEHRQS
jgi:RNA polymerase sigma-70 factor (ECF subfamily)